METWMTGVGNCVDMTIVIGALARALGLDARATVVSLDGENYIHMLIEGPGVIADPVECDRLFTGAAMNALPATLRAVAAAKTAFPPAAIIDPLIAMARAPEPIIATYAGPANAAAQQQQRMPAAAPAVYTPPAAFNPAPAPAAPGIRPEFQPPPEYGGAGGGAAPPEKTCECPPRWPWLAAGLGLGWFITRVNK
ncbi:MAG: hypothetical protein KCHDKBKB_03111 [Elusimicrobia bacterium]|nr:hypothetical protein [Elusimicrobiota bacterium]